MGITTKELKQTLDQIEECDFICMNTGNYAYAKFTLPGWAGADLTLAAEKRKSNLIEKLRNYGVDVEV